ncbi:DUF6204 family protein [Streptosporangium lutulentum]|uniref:Uncharacterized protein n=1 Tax=Streptosporangium lutulentum TaxID=1461250 RepID=A0ABT9QPF0_9ACTN|nr:DUF6204 family protein [Streptosporangium lutulentum]MDP9848639.1 hypothetical protein [Streptosporangium lutulentum]
MFRVTIRGTFDGLSDAGRAAVLAAGGAAFTEAGAFTHDATLSAFTFRCQVPAGPDDDENEATRRAIAALDAYGHPYRVLRVAVTDMRTIKIRHKGRV